MKLISLNLGKPREINWQDRLITTSIFKSSVPHKCKVSFLNIEGDEQSDLKNHGGKDKAIYSYSIEYYDYWKNNIDRTDWSYGLFGENLTTSGLQDDKVKIGDIYKIGTAKLMAVQPRFPCTKLNARLGLDDMIERFYNGRRNGIYFRVIEEGEIQFNDEIELINESPYSITILDVVECKINKGEDQVKLERILELPYFPENIKESFRLYLK